MRVQDAAGSERDLNGILAALPEAQWLLLSAHSEIVPYKAGMPISMHGDPGAFVVFPFNCLVSLRCELADGHGSEFAMVGNEGMVGISAFTGADPQATDALVQCPGRALRIRAPVARRLFDAEPPFRSLVLHYMQALLRATSQTSVCYRHHGIEQQLARILLASRDRLDVSALPLTHEVIARMLGVRREGITEAANALRRAGVIEYSRGRVHLLDIAALERRACECYGIVKDGYRQLRSAPLP
jgi:CRP-like cAMP-binding protein